jgi:hypothetical protein
LSPRFSHLPSFSTRPYRFGLPFKNSTVVLPLHLPTSLAAMAAVSPADTPAKRGKGRGRGGRRLPQPPPTPSSASSASPASAIAKVSPRPQQQQQQHPRRPNGTPLRAAGAAQQDHPPRTPKAAWGEKTPASGPTASGARQPVPAEAHATIGSKSRTSSGDVAERSGRTASRVPGSARGSGTAEAAGGAQHIAEERRLPPPQRKQLRIGPTEVLPKSETRRGDGFVDDHTPAPMLGQTPPSMAASRTLSSPASAVDAARKIRAAARASAEARARTSEDSADSLSPNFRPFTAPEGAQGSHSTPNSPLSGRRPGSVGRGPSIGGPLALVDPADYARRTLMQSSIRRNSSAHSGLGGIVGADRTSLHRSLAESIDTPVHRSSSAAPTLWSPHALLTTAPSSGEETKAVELSGAFSWRLSTH